MKYKTIYWAILMIIYLVPFIDYLNIMNFGLVNSFDNLIQIWLLISAVWVAYETLKLRELTCNQLSIQIAPILVVYIRDKQDRVTVRNIGNGPAFLIQFEQINIYLENVKKKIEYSLQIGDPPVLIPGEEREIIGAMILEGVALLTGTSSLKPKYATAKFEFSITYEDMEKIPYVSRVSAGKGGVKLLSYERKN